MVILISLNVSLSDLKKLLSPTKLILLFYIFHTYVSSRISIRLRNLKVFLCVQNCPLQVFKQFPAFFSLGNILETVVNTDYFHTEVRRSQVRMRRCTC